MLLLMRPGTVAAQLEDRILANIELCVDALQAKNICSRCWLLLETAII